MSLDQYLSRLSYDTRMIQWNMTRNIISKEDITNHLKSLKDLSDLCEPMAGEEEPDESPEQDS